MIRAIIIDDSPQALDYLKSIVSKPEYGIELLGTASDVEEGINLIRSVKPDLVFLDIELGNQTGFDLLDQIGNVDFKIIFTTGHNKYAIEAFRVNALHYLLKPVDPVELQEAIKRLMFNKSDNYIDAIKSLIKDFKDVKKIPLSTEEGIRYVAPSEIIYIKADGSYSHVKLSSGASVLLTGLLKNFEEQLCNTSFFRVSKSFLINMQFVKMYRRVDGGTIEMTDNTLIPVPRRRRELFILKMSEYLK